MTKHKPLESKQAASRMKKEIILFDNNNQAEAVFSPVNAEPDEIISALGIKGHKAVIMIIGGADSIDEGMKPKLIQLFSRGIARAAAETNALVIDGGTQSGVMAMMGQGIADRGYKSPLLGVAPAGLITYPGGSAAAGTQLDPNHSHFVLVEGNAWGSETAVMYKLAKALTREVRGVAILVGGGRTATTEVIQAVRLNLPLIVVDGSDGLAGEIANAWKNRPALPDDPTMAEIIADGEIHIHSLSNSVKGMERLIIRELGGDNVLMQAWEHFADYDMNANIQQKRFNNLQISILVLGVLGTAMAIIKEVYIPRNDAGDPIMNSWDRWWVLHKILILVPILLTVLVTAANRFKQGNKWLLLRAGAEAIKREIYRYRARAMYYKIPLYQPPQPGQPYIKPPSPEQQLAKRIEDITHRTMRTEVNTSSVLPYTKDKGFPPYMYAAQGKDDGFSFLTPDRYVEFRLGDQLRYFRKKSIQHEKQLKQFQWLIFIIGGLGAFLAAIDYQVWIALTTAAVAALTTYLSYRQTENTLMKYNQAYTDLNNVKAWWTALSAEEQANPDNVDSLVKHTEQVLETELDGWVQQMQNALAELRKEQGPIAETEEKTETLEPDTQTKTAQPDAQPGTVDGKAAKETNVDAQSKAGKDDVKDGPTS